MADRVVVESLEKIDALPDKRAPFEELLAALCKNHSIAPDFSTNINAVVDAIFSSSLGAVGARNLLDVIISQILSSTSIPNDAKIDIGTHLLGNLQSQASTFEEQVSQIRDLLATAYETSEDFLSAATTLALIPLNSSQRQITPTQKAQIWIRITRNYLEIDDTTSAETYLNKLKNVIHDVSSPDLLILFHLSHARIQDARRDFLSAAKTYQDISLASTVSEDERFYSLSMAAKCAVLAPAGPARARALKRLYSDERAPQLAEFSILEKMYFERVITPAEIAKFAEGLQPHQLARTADGSTVLEKAMGEHNLLGASKLYSNIRFGELGRLLGVDAERAEEMTARMIEQGRLVGRIDQIECVIWFEGGEATGEGGSARREGQVGRELRRWDDNVEGLAEGVEGLMGMLQQRYPDFVAKHLVV